MEKACGNTPIVVGCFYAKHIILGRLFERMHPSSGVWDVQGFYVLCRLHSIVTVLPLAECFNLFLSQLPTYSKCVLDALKVIKLMTYIRI